MDLEDQGAIKAIAEHEGRENLLVLLGVPEPDAAEMFAQALTTGDPTYAGPLAGVALRLPVYHIFEPEMKRLVPAAVYKEQVEMMELALPASELGARVRQVREAAGVPESG